MIRSRMLSTLVACCFLSVQMILAPAAQAAMVTTDSVLHAQTRNEQQARILAALQRSEARKMLQQNGVSMAEVETRLNRLSNEQVAQLADRADHIPAGQSLLELVLVVFLVLILLDVLGVTDVFPNV